MQEFPEYESLMTRPVEIKNREFQRQGRLKHLIFGSQLTKPLLEKLFRSADIIRSLSRIPEGNRQLRDLLADKLTLCIWTHSAIT